jgi:hypothetical protein
MRHLIERVRASVKEKNWYAALATALMLPDVCRNLQKGPPYEVIGLHRVV